MNHVAWGAVVAGAFFALGPAACGSSKPSSGFGDDQNGDGGDDTGANDDGGGDDGGIFGGDGGDGGTMLQGDPTTCAEAAQYKTYIGCDYWPTVVANNAWSIFDFAVVVANGQSVPAMVTVTGNGQNQMVTVPAGGLTKIFLPWVPSLKGPDFDS